MDDVAAPVSLPDVVAAALTAASPLLRDQHVTVSTAIDVTDREIPPLRGSAAALERAVLNLIVNAVQAMEGQADDKALRLLVTGGTGAGSLSLLVADSGPGFTSESSARAFERFFTTKPPGKGTGLGLWIVRETISAFGGSVRVEPQTARGGQIQLVLPLPRPRAPRPKRTIAPPDARSQPACSRRDQLDRAHRGWPWTVAPPWLALDR